MLKLRHAAILMLLTTVFSCTGMCNKGRSSMQPEEVVESYLNAALNMNDVSERQKLLEYTTGNLRSAIAEVSDDTIRKAYIERKFKLTSYSLLERRDRTPRETEVSFQLVYQDLSEAPNQDPGQAATIKTDNTVRVIRENEAWAISDVLGKKTSIEFPDLKDMEIKASAQ